MNDAVKRILSLHQEAMEEHRNTVRSSRRSSILLLGFYLLVSLVAVLLLSGSLANVVPVDTSALSGHMIFVLTLFGVFVAGLFAMIAWLYAQMSRLARISARLIDEAFELGRSSR